MTRASGEPDSVGVSPLVVLVEDEAAMRKFVRASLTGHNYRVVEAVDAREGIAMTRSHNPDIVLLDLGLPDRDGLDVTRDIRGWSAVPIVVISARGQESDKVDALDAGADDYLTKPFSFVVLLARIRALLRRGAAVRPPIFTAGDLSLDPASHEVHLGGREVALTTREFSLLEYLIRRPGQVVGKIELLEHVWDASEETAPNAVEVYVGYLRRKLGAEKIATVRGAGYKLLP